MENIKLSIKIHFTTILAICILSFSLFFSISELKESLFNERRDKTRSVVEVALSTLKYFHELQTQNILTEAEAKKEAISQLKSLRYNKDNYFFMFDTNLTMIMHPIRKELTNKDVSQLKDSTGTRQYVKFLETVKKYKSGFVQHRGPKIGIDKKIDFKKISYVGAFEPWGYIVGSGLYVDDLDAAIWKFGSNIVMLGILFLFLICAMNGMLSRSITGPLTRSIDTIKQIFAGNLDVELAKGKRLDEIGDLERAMLVMRDNSVNLIRIKSGLENTLNPLIIVDKQNDIVFKNKSAVSMIDMLSKNSGTPSDIKSLNSFNQKELLTFLDDATLQTQNIELGDYLFKLMKAPVFNNNAHVIGFVIEWVDITAEHALQQTLEDLIHKASSGDLSPRIKDLVLQASNNPTKNNSH